MRSALAALCVAAACQPVELEYRRYTCDPSGDRSVGAAQCPNGGRCGLEGFCHRDGDVSEPWRCEVAEDCEGGFQCGVGSDGVSRECHDPKKGVAYRCLTSAECSNGWTCGLDDSRLRRCHDPSMPRAWPCETTADCVGGWSCGLGAFGKECHDPNAPGPFRCVDDGDCLGGWKCGLTDARNARECHNPAAPRTFACMSDGDCLGGWTCGLAKNRVDGECHDPTHPEPWPCTNDAECLAGWRCGPERTCLDPSRDALRSPPALSVDAGPVRNPTAQAPITAAAVSPAFGPVSADLAVAAIDRGGRLEAVLRRQQMVERIDLGSVPPGTRLVAPGPRSYWYGGSTYRRTSDNYVYAAFPDAGIGAYQLVDGGVRVTTLTDEDGLPVPALVDRFKIGSTEDPDEIPNILGFSADRSVIIFDGPNDAFTRSFTGSDLASPLLDIDEVFLRNGVSCLFFVDVNGAWVLEARNGVSGQIEPLHTTAFGNGACAPFGFKVEGLRLARWNRALVKGRTWDGGAPQVALWDLSPMLVDHASSFCSSEVDDVCNLAQANAPIPFDVELGPCQACPVGDFLDVNAVESASGALEVETRCSRGDGGAFVFYRLSPRLGGGCEARPLTGSSSLFVEPSLQPAEAIGAGRVAYSGPSGGFWFGSEIATASSLSWDRLPLGLVTLGSQVVVLATGVGGVESTAFGVASFTQRDVELVASNEPTWVFGRGQLRSLEGAAVLEGGRTLAISGRALPDQAVLQRVQSPAGPIAVLAAEGQLLSAEVDLTPGSSFFSTFQLRTSVVNPIRSMAFPSSSAPDAGFAGYVVSGTSVARVRVESPTRWVVEDVPLPSSFVPRAVWFDGERARVGGTTGEVYSLPSRVLIGERLPSGEAEDSLRACSQDFVLSGDGLFRLTLASGTAVGRWQRVELAGAFPPGDLQGGRLFSVGPMLYVFGRSGRLSTLFMGPCP